MRKLLTSIVVLVSACSHIQPGVHDDSDITCSARIYIRQSASDLISCREAQAILNYERAPMDWSYIFTAGTAGLDFHTNYGADIRYSYGATWQQRKIVEVDWGQVNRWDILRHALRHVRGEVVYNEDTP